MPESAFERSLLEAIFALRVRIQRHDRFVVIGLLFSLLPFPPACFVGLFISSVNMWLLRVGRLGRQEESLVRIGLVFSVVNSLLAVALIVFGFRYLSGLELDGSNVSEYAMRWVQEMLKSWRSWWHGDGSSQGVFI